MLTNPQKSAVIILNKSEGLFALLPILIAQPLTTIFVRNGWLGVGTV